MLMDWNVMRPAVKNAASPRGGMLDHKPRRHLVWMAPALAVACQGWGADAIASFGGYEAVMVVVEAESASRGLTNNQCIGVVQCYNITFVHQ